MKKKFPKPNKPKLNIKKIRIEEKTFLDEAKPNKKKI